MPLEIALASCVSTESLTELLTELVCPPIIVVTDANRDWSSVVPPGSTTVNIDETTLPNNVVPSEGTDVITVIVVSGLRAQLLVNGYELPTTAVTGSDFAGTGICRGFGVVVLGLGLVIVSRRSCTPVSAVS